MLQRSAGRTRSKQDWVEHSPALWWLAYVAFVVYGSLVPLDFKPMPIIEAWEAFLTTPFLILGVESRADWVANGVLYVPVGFLTIGLLSLSRSHSVRLFQLSAAVAFCLGLALVVEFSQLFFPPRTVSRNDIIAEVIGSGIGIVLAIRWSGWFRELLSSLSGKFEQVTFRLLQAYAIGYAVFSLFPFDFLVSAFELNSKLHSESWGWLFSAHGISRGLVMLSAKLAAEILAVVPIGLALAYWNTARQREVTHNALLLGALLGLAIEVTQFFIFSGVSEGVSLLTRALGMYCGARLGRDWIYLVRLRLSPKGRRLVLPLSLLYLVALAAVNGWFEHNWHGFDVASTTLADTRFLPFYYHYYTTEQAALISLASVALMYAPIGLLAWFCWWSPGMALWISGFATLTMESSKLFLGGLHPDPTNLLVGSVSAWIVTKLLQRLSTPVKRVSIDVLSPPPSLSEPALNLVPAGLPARAQFALAVAVGTILWVALDFPFQPMPLALLLLAYAALLWFRPWLLWCAVPAGLPILDLAPWSGRFYFDEFDYFVLLSIVIGYARTAVAPKEVMRDRIGLFVTGLLAITFVVGTLRGLWPLNLPDANSFYSIHSPFNALRLAKGALWALLLSALLPRFSASRHDIGRLFGGGMLIGLTGTVLIVAWERFSFPGLFNFTDVYRVTGPFSQMNTGGADLECYLVAATPFAVLLFLRGRSLAIRASAGVLVAAATYALMVTFARIGYAGFAVAITGAIVVAWLAKKAGSATSQPASGASIYQRYLAGFVLLAVVLTISVSIFRGSFAQERMALLGSDLSIRQTHWADALAMRDPGLSTELFGMGMGRFPETHFWRSIEPKASSYQLTREGSNTFLRLGNGYPLYMEQIVRIEPNRDYVLEVDLRSLQPLDSMTASLCEKWLLTSGRCVAASGTVGKAERGWVRHRFHLNSGEIGRSSWLIGKLVKLSLMNTSAIAVDFDNLRLISDVGIELTRNGGFSNGLDHWFFSVDQDLPWHIWSMPVAILFDLGWFGLFTFGALFLLAIKRSAQDAWHGDAEAGAYLASLTGVLVISILDTVIDAPRFLLLLLLLALLGTGQKSTASR